MQIGKIMKTFCGACGILCAVASFCLAGGFMPGKKSLVIGKDIAPAKFREFYYTVSTTTYPPKFQRYRFYLENGKPAFYHEKREGNKVFLTEKDITISGTMPLGAEDWENFWSLVKGGMVTDRVEQDTTGNQGPWLFLYWDGDKGKKQVYEFAEAGMIQDFEKFCADLKAREIEQSRQ